MLTTKVCSTIAVAAASRAMVGRKKTMAFATIVAAVRRLQIFIVGNFVIWFSLC